MGIATEGLVVRVNDKEVGCLESLGDVSRKREIAECLNSNEIRVKKSKTDPISMSVLYDPKDTGGKNELEKAYNDGVAVSFEIELSDIPDGGTNGTKFTWSSTAITELTLQPQKDDDVLANFTATFNGDPTITAAA